MKKYFLAIDIGASSGRHVLAHKENDKIILEEIYRFANGTKKEGSRLYWDIDNLFEEVLFGIKKCALENKIPVSIGIDTWGVDFVLMKQGKKLENPVSYRDHRTDHIDKKVYEYITEEELYKKTGIQKQHFNTIYQLMALKTQEKEKFDQTEKILMIPDYLNYKLTGKMATEYTNATTTQLVNAETKDWDWALLDRLGYPRDLFCKIESPGTFLGHFTEEIEREMGFNAKIILPATHDTGSAVMAVPTNRKKIIYISSGTWSLMGTELEHADCSDLSSQYNFTNEGGFHYRYRYLKNIMGLWMIQSVKKEIGKHMSFDEICDEAKKSKITSLVDCNNSRFLSPNSMVDEICIACSETGQPVPEKIGDIAAVIYNSLAICYRNVIREIEQVTKETYDTIYIIGGGSKDHYLNELTARKSGKTVYAGPTEATAIGNICAQMISEGVIQDLQNAREMVFRSFEIKKY